MSKCTKMFTKALIRNANQILLSSNRLVTHVCNDWNCYGVKLHFTSASFSTDNSRISRVSISFTVFLTIKTSSQNILITLLQISLQLHEHRGGYWKKELPWTTLEEQFPGNGVISLLWQIRCHSKPDHKTFSAVSNTTVVAIFPNLFLPVVSLTGVFSVITHTKTASNTSVVCYTAVFSVFTQRSSPQT